MRRAIVVLALLASTAAFAQGQPDLEITAAQEYLVLPGLPTTLHVRYLNRSQAVPATATYVTVTSVQPFVSAPEGCILICNHASCRVGTVEPRGGGEPVVHTLTFGVRTPAPNDQRFRVVAQIWSREIDAVPVNNIVTLEVLARTGIVVTTTADSGPGSLREAIHTANASCTGETACIIAFRIPETAAQWVTIAPHTPLPHLTGSNIAIDGETQTAFFGDTQSLRSGGGADRSPAG